MEVINPFLQENKPRIIAFLDEISASALHIISSCRCAIFYRCCLIVRCHYFYCRQ